MKKLWFKNKTYGYGWFPVSWEGWVTILVFLILVWLGIYFISGNTALAAEQKVYQIVAVTIVLSIILVIVAAKTGEKPGWHWGDKKKH